MVRACRRVREPPCEAVRGSHPRVCLGLCGADEQPGGGRDPLSGGETHWRAATKALPAAPPPITTMSKSSAAGDVVLSRRSTPWRSAAPKRERSSLSEDSIASAARTSKKISTGLWGKVVQLVDPSTALGMRCHTALGLDEFGRRSDGGRGRRFLVLALKNARGVSPATSTESHLPADAAPGRHTCGGAERDDCGRACCRSSHAHERVAG